MKDTSVVPCDNFLGLELEHADDFMQWMTEKRLPGWWPRFLHCFFIMSLPKSIFPPYPLCFKMLAFWFSRSSFNIQCTPLSFFVAYRRSIYNIYELSFTFPSIFSMSSNIFMKRNGGSIIWKVQKNTPKFKILWKFIILQTLNLVYQKHAKN